MRYVQKIKSTQFIILLSHTYNLGEDAVQKVSEETNRCQVQVSTSTRGGFSRKTDLHRSSRFRRAPQPLAILNIRGRFRVPFGDLAALINSEHATTRTS